MPFLTWKHLILIQFITCCKFVICIVLFLFGNNFLFSTLHMNILLPNK
uniref:Uncharacterized protein n=1 Tax=Anguilla anguilla TaxID=7936 RepID=A0A0E9RY48_ANGAN